MASGGGGPPTTPPPAPTPDAPPPAPRHALRDHRLHANGMIIPVYLYYNDALQQLSDFKTSPTALCIDGPVGQTEADNIVAAAATKEKRNDEGKVIAFRRRTRTLRALWMRHKGLTTMPHSMQQLHDLEELILDGNTISRIPDELTNLKALRVLSMKRNGLKTLPDNIGDLTALMDLDLLHNKLKTLPISFKNLTNLIILNLAQNRISDTSATNLAVVLNNHPKLLSLELQRNSLTAVGCGTIIVCAKTINRLIMLNLMGNDGYRHVRAEDIDDLEATSPEHELNRQLTDARDKRTIELERIDKRQEVAKYRSMVEKGKAFVNQEGERFRMWEWVFGATKGADGNPLPQVLPDELQREVIKHLSIKSRFRLMLW